MSEENVEVISRAIDAWNRGDLDGFLAGAHPDIEWHPVLPAGVEGSGGLYRGHDEARQFWAEFWAMFDEFRITIQSARAVGTSVLVLAQIQGRAHSGVPLDTPWGAVFEMRDGLCVKTEAFLDHKSALEAAGLREQAMSEGNVEIVRRIYEAAIRRDAASVLALYDPEVELDASRIGVSNRPSGADTYHGHDGLRDLFREWHEAWGKIEYDYEELIDAGEQVIAVVNRHARGRASGVEVERPFALLWTVREGKVVRVVWFLTREEALEAAGLRE